jgi:hypothetical protein
MFIFHHLWTIFIVFLHVSTTVFTAFTQDIVMWTTSDHNPLNVVDNFLDPLSTLHLFDIILLFFLVEHLC